MRKFASILGLILSIVLIALGVYNLLEGFTYLNSGFEPVSANFSGDTASNTSFGADFYTYSYRATRYAANNVNALGNYIEKVVNGVSSLGLMILGLAGLALSLYGLGAAADSKKQLELLRSMATGRERSATKQLEKLEQIATVQERVAKKQQDLLTRIAEKEVTVAAPRQSAQPVVSTPVQPVVSTPVQPVVTTPVQAVVEPVRPAVNWQCAICGHQNPEHQETCDVCGNAKGAKSAPAPAPVAMPAGKAWTCPVCAMENPATASQCVCCSEARPADGGVASRPAPGGWVCQTCGMQNGASASECAVCGEKRP